MAAGMIPLEALAGEPTLAAEDYFPQVSVSPRFLPTTAPGPGKTDPELNSGVMLATVSWDDVPTLNDADLTVMATTTAGAVRKPIDFDTRPRAGTSGIDEQPGWAFATENGRNSLTFWTPVLGSQDQDWLLDTANMLVFHKVTGTGEDVSFDNLVDRVGAVLHKIDYTPLPISGEEYMNELKTLSDGEKDKLLEAVRKPVERLSSEFSAGTITEEQVKMNADERAVFTDTVTGCMGYENMYPNCGVAENDTVAVTMSGFVKLDGENNWGVTKDTAPVVFTVKPGNDGKTFGFGEKPQISDNAIDVPSAVQGLVYTGKQQVAVRDSDGYKLSGTFKATNAGEYEAIATLEDGYIWNNGSKDPKTIKWSIKAASLKKAKITVGKKTYNGKALTPGVSVKLNSKTLTKGKDFTVSFKNNKNCGKATVTVTGKGNYTDSASGSFIIIPKKAAIKSFKSTKKKTVKVTWKKSGGGVDGYKVQTALDNGFKKSLKTYTVKGADKTSKTIKKLKSKKTYYVRVCAYKTVGKTTYKGEWSNVKKIKVK